MCDNARPAGKGTNSIYFFLLQLLICHYIPMITNTVESPRDLSKTIVLSVIVRLSRWRGLNVFCN